MKPKNHKTTEEYKQIARDLSKLDTFSHEHHYQLVNLSNKRSLTLKEKVLITELQAQVKSYS
jgi:hypothetical protein